ncbi:Protein rds1 [Cladobotryum mycophilum]|uniref:Protein rds1 n=1 Tax=Cladobotryum mycophilum TaxID=491253 RepID=A0ABR0SWC7_9HYPO
MFFSQAAIVLAAAAGIVSGAPVVEKRTGINDGDVLNYALTLEHLEDRFYREGLSRFTQAQFAAAGFDATFYNNIKKVSSDETDHVNFLTTALKAAGVKPVAECKYNFGVTDVKSFILTASILEGVGVSAYLGAAASIANKAYLTAAGSILTVEARHSSYIRGGLKQVPFAQPFDTPLSIDEVYSLASQFIVSCPKENPALPVKAFPRLTLSATSPKALKAGDTISLETTAKPTGNDQVYAAFIAVTGPVFVPATYAYGGYLVKIPTGFAGQTYVVLNKDNKAVTDDSVFAGPVILEPNLGTTCLVPDFGRCGLKDLPGGGISALRKRKYTDKLARALLFQKTTVFATIHLLATKSGCEYDDRALEHDPIGYLKHENIRDQILDFLGKHQTAVFLGALQDIENTLKRVYTHVAGLVPTYRGRSDDLVGIIEANLATERRKVDLIPRVKILFSSNDIKKTIDELDVATNSLSRFSQLLLMESARTVAVESSQNSKLAKALRQIHNLATGLYTALCQSCSGTCHSQHEASMFLEDRMDVANELVLSSRRRSKEKDPMIAFQVLFAATLLTPIETWCHEVLIRVLDQNGCAEDIDLVAPLSKIKIILPAEEEEPTAQVWDRKSVVPVEDFCAAIVSATNRAQPLAFVLHAVGRMGTMATDERTIFPKENVQRIALKAVLSMPSGQGFPLRLRMLLALRLASSLLQLSQTRWTGHTWSKDSIFFLTHPVSDGMQPCVDFNKAFVSASLDSLNAACKTPAEPKLMLLELGILLLEIWHQQTLEDRFGLGEDDAPRDYCTRLARAVEWSEDTENPSPRLYEDAILYCVGGNLGRGPLTWGTQGLWNGVCKEIVDPLFKNCK